VSPAHPQILRVPEWPADKLPGSRFASSPVPTPQYLRLARSWRHAGGGQEDGYQPGVDFQEDMRRRRAALLSGPVTYYDEERTF
jgi:hypothetical protein